MTAMVTAAKIAELTLAMSGALGEYCQDRSIATDSTMAVSFRQGFQSAVGLHSFAHSMGHLPGWQDGFQAGVRYQLRGLLASLPRERRIAIAG